MAYNDSNIFVFKQLLYTVHDMAHASVFHNLSTYMGAWMGSITATGSVRSQLLIILR